MIVESIQLQWGRTMVIKIQDLVNANLYKSEEEAIQDALRHLIRSHPDLRIQIAVHHYQTEGLSLARAAQLAGVSWAQMREILQQRGISIAMGPETQKEAQQEVEALETYLANRT